MQNPTVRRIGVLGAAVLAIAGTGCESNGRAGGDTRTVPAPRPTPAETIGDENATYVDSTPIVHADWAKLGYRWDWAGSPCCRRAA